MYSTADWAAVAAAEHRPALAVHHRGADRGGSQGGGRQVLPFQYSTSVLQVKKKFGEVVERCSALAEESTHLTATQRDNTERLAAQHSHLTFLRRQIDHLKSNCF